jgi:hypothetical protein
MFGTKGKEHNMKLVKSKPKANKSSIVVNSNLPW